MSSTTVVFYVSGSCNSGVFGIFISGQNKKLGSRIRNKVLYGQRDGTKAFLCTRDDFLFFKPQLQWAPLFASRL